MAENEGVIPRVFDSKARRENSIIMHSFRHSSLKRSATARGNLMNRLASNFSPARKSTAYPEVHPEALGRLKMYFIVLTRIRLPSFAFRQIRKGDDGVLTHRLCQGRKWCVKCLLRS